MCHHSMYCYPATRWSKQDEKSFLEEQEKILEAKLATIRHMKKSLAESKEEKTKA